MYPKEYVKRKILGGNGNRKRDYYAANILGILSFFLVSLLVAPLFHESLHIIVLKIYGCYYSMNLGFNWIGGIYASILPFCDLPVRQSVILLLIGVFANSLVSVSLFIASWYTGKMGKIPLSIFLTYIALGFFSDLLFHFFLEKGDLINVLELLNRRDIIGMLPVIGFLSLFAVAIYVYKHLGCILRDYRVITTELEDIKSFLDEIK